MDFLPLRPDPAAAAIAEMEQKLERGVRMRRSGRCKFFLCFKVRRRLVEEYSGADVSSVQGLGFIIDDNIAELGGLDGEFGAGALNLR